MYDVTAGRVTELRETPCTWALSLWPWLGMFLMEGCWIVTGLTVVVWDGPRCCRDMGPGRWLHL